MSLFTTPSKFRGKMDTKPETQIRQPAGDFEKPREACGIFGIHGHQEAATLTYFGLYALQHRGQESAGIAVLHDKGIVAHKGMGLVPDVFDITHLEQLHGKSAIGHVRYSTTGSSILTNAQPFVINHRNKSYAVAHNGNIVNAQAVPFLPMLNPLLLITETNRMPLPIMETL
jgi:predicted glutamine amidotransferase